MRKKNEKAAPRPKAKPKPRAKPKKEVKADEIAARMKQAKANRAANSGLLEEMRKDPALAATVKEAMCADLRRVYAIPREILGPSASRARYREHGYYSDSLATYLFGVWAQFQREAGLQESLGVRKVERNISATARAQIVANYADENVKPWDGAYSTLDMDKDKVTLVIGSDYHSKFLCPFARRVWMDVVKELQPDGVRYNGDGPDFPALSKHRQLPGHFAMSVQDEIDLWVEFMGDTRAAAPTADIKWILGNHDIRLVTAIAEAFPIFASMRSCRFHELFKLDELRTGLVARSSFLNPSSASRKVDSAENWETLADAQGRPFWTTVHGFLCGNGAPGKHLARFGTWGVNGHLHNPCSDTGGSLATGPLRWWQTGCMAHPAAVAASYMPGPIAYAGWAKQFIVVSLFPRARHVHVEEVTIGDVAVFRDRVWRITDEESALLDEMREVL